MAEFKNIFIGKKVVQQAWLGDRVQIFQSPGWETTPMTVQQVWGHKLKSAAADLVVDKHNNIYAVYGNVNLSKFDSDGNQLWVKTVSGGRIERLAIDHEGYIYTGDSKGCLTKSDSEGIKIWQNDIGWHIYDIAVDSENNVYASCEFWVEKYDSNGKEIWGENTGSNHVNGLAIDSQDNVVVVTNDHSIIKYNSAGNIIWSKQYGSYNFNDCVVDRLDNIYTINANGEVRKIDRDGTQIWMIPMLSGAVLQRIGIDNQDNVYPNAYQILNKYSSDGTLIWSVKPPSSINGAYVDAIGNIFVSTTGSKDMLLEYIQLKSTGGKLK